MRIVPRAPRGDESSTFAVDQMGRSDDAAAMFDVREMLSALRRQMWLLLLLPVISVAATYYLLSQEQTQYRAAALFRLKDAQAEVAGGVLPSQTGDSRPIEDRLASELLVLRGRQVGRAVVDREGFRLFDKALGVPSPLIADAQVALPADRTLDIRLRFDTGQVVAEVGERRVRARYGDPLEVDSVRFSVPARPDVASTGLSVLTRESAVDWAIGMVNARPTERTNAVTVTATSPNRALSIRLANGFVEEYQKADIARAKGQNRRRRAYLEQRLRETDDSLVRVQTALGRLRGAAGVLNTQAQSQAEQSIASESDTRRKQLVAEQRRRRELLAEIDRSESPAKTPAFRALLSSPEMASNLIVSRTYARLTDLETRREELLGSGKPPSHEDVKQVDRLIAGTETQLVEAVRSQINALDDRINALGDIRQSATADLNQLSPVQAKEVRLSDQLEATRAVASQLRGELQKVRLAEAVEMGQVEIVEPATTAPAVVSNRTLKLALGLVFGLLLATAVALLREYFNTSIHRHKDMERALGVPSLAVIPQLRRPSRRLGLFRVRRTPEAAGTEVGVDAYRMLRTRLLFAETGFRREFRSLLVTSAWVDEGKSTTATNLALCMAQQGMRVLLMDCDLRRPCLHEVFRLRNDVGLTSLLIQHGNMEDAIRPSGVEPWLDVLPSGPPLAAVFGPAEMLGGYEMEQWLSQCVQQYDLVVMDSPPVLITPETAVLAARADSALLVLRAGRTSRAMAQGALDQLASVGAQVIGAVLNDPDAMTASNDEYGAKYYYHSTSA